MRADPMVPAVSTAPPRGEKSTLATAPPGRSTTTGWAVGSSHTLAVPSLLAVTISFPSGLNEIPLSEVCDSVQSAWRQGGSANEIGAAPPATGQTRVVPSSLDAARSDPEGENRTAVNPEVTLGPPGSV